ncbi:SPFH domain-containing protein [Cellulomonas sp. CW35]|uniref:SPFH domain-containing protein n=1 Tax=Cellulomonas sp. CW35 TaxID=3458249 RepID=UPI004033160A
MGVIQAFTGALGGTFADQWKDIITAGQFTEHTVVGPGIHRHGNGAWGSNVRGTAGVITNGSKIFVPENTAAFVFSQSGIEDVITEPGGYEYRSGQSSVLAGDSVATSILKQAASRFSYAGQTSEQKEIAFVNLRELRGIKFGTRGPTVYHDRHYGADLEIRAYGSFSLRVVDPVAFVRNFLPPNTRYYTFDSPAARQQILSEFLQAFVVAVNSLSSTYRISELPAHAQEISDAIADDEAALGSWIRRFGLDVVQVGIESIEFTPESRELVKQFSADMLSVKAYEGLSQQAANTAAQQKVAQGVRDHGLGDGGGTLLGINVAQALSQQPTPPGRAASLDEQIETVKKLKDLLDAGILSEEQFEQKKREAMGL